MPHARVATRLLASLLATTAASAIAPTQVYVQIAMITAGDVDAVKQVRRSRRVTTDSSARYGGIVTTKVNQLAAYMYILPSTAWRACACLLLMQTFVADFYLCVVWRDDSVNASAPFSPATSFWPAVEFTNLDLTSPSSMNWEFYVNTWFNVPPRLLPPEAANGTWISAFTRVSGFFSVPLLIQDFPQDRHQLTIRMQSKHFNASFITYAAIPGTQAGMLPPQLDVIGWRVLRADVVTYLHYVPAFEQTWAELRAFIEVERLSAYYLNRLVANSALLVFLSFASATLRPEVPERVVVIVAVWGALVTWTLIILSDTPRTGYLTRIDSFLNLSFGVVFALAISHAAAYILRELAHVKVAKAKRESMAKLTKTLERLAAKGDAGAQAMLSSRHLPIGGTAASNHGSHAKQRSGTTPKAAERAPWAAPSHAWGGHGDSPGANASPPPVAASAVSAATVVPYSPASDPQQGEEVNGRGTGVQDHDTGGIVTPKGKQDAHTITINTRVAAAEAGRTDMAASPSLSAATVTQTSAAKPYLSHSVRRRSSRDLDTEDDVLYPECTCSSPRATWLVVQRLWAATSLARKLDIIITVGAALFYIGGIGYIFLRAPTVTSVDTR